MKEGIERWGVDELATCWESFVEKWDRWSVIWALPASMALARIEGCAVSCVLERIGGGDMDTRREAGGVEASTMLG